MLHSKEQAYNFIMMLIFSRCTASLNNYSTLYIAHSIPSGLFSCYRIVIIFEYESLKPSILKTTKQKCIVFLLFVTYNVHSNVRMATGCVD